MARSSASSRPLTDHDEIRSWAEERGATPTCVRGTGGREDVGMIRLDFPGYSGAGKLEEISWDEWFDKFDESGLALLVQDQTARGQKSNFNKLVSRETAGVSEGNGRSSRSQSRNGGRAASERGGEYESSSEDFEEESGREGPERARVAASSSSRNRRRQPRTRGSSRTARSSRSGARQSSQSGRSRGTTSTRTRTANGKRSQTKRGSRPSAKTSVRPSARSGAKTRSRTTAKKAPARVTARSSRTSHGQSSSSRKRAA